MSRQHRSSGSSRRSSRSRHSTRSAPSSRRNSRSPPHHQELPVKNQQLKNNNFFSPFSPQIANNPLSMNYSQIPSNVDTHRSRPTSQESPLSLLNLSSQSLENFPINSSISHHPEFTSSTISAATAPPSSCLCSPTPPDPMLKH